MPSKDDGQVSLLDCCYDLLCLWQITYQLLLSRFCDTGDVEGAR